MTDWDITRTLVALDDKSTMLGLYMGGKTFTEQQLQLVEQVIGRLLGIAQKHKAK